MTERTGVHCDRLPWADRDFQAAIGSDRESANQMGMR